MITYKIRGLIKAIYTCYLSSGNHKMFPVQNFFNMIPKASLVVNRNGSSFS